MSAQEIAPMMRDFAEQAVRLGREFKINLDYSERSLQEVERLLARFHDELTSANAGSKLEEMAKIWGGYLGEVVRRRFGGEWSIEKYPAGDFLIVTLNVNGARLFPSMKVHKRLTEGSSENIWSFYQSVRAKLEVQPGAKVQ